MSVRHTMKTWNTNSQFSVSKHEYAIIWNCPRHKLPKMEHVTTHDIDSVEDGNFEAINKIATHIVTCSCTN